MAPPAIMCAWLSSTRQGLRIRAGVHVGEENGGSTPSSAFESLVAFPRVELVNRRRAMFARIAIFESTDPAADEKLMPQAMEIVEPIIREMPGIQGYMELADRSSGKSLSISLFDSEENAVAAEPIFDEEMPRALGDLMQQFSGRRLSVERYDVLVDERVSTAAATR
jgi:hypothetical protein